MSPHVGFPSWAFPGWTWASIFMSGSLGLVQVVLHYLLLFPFSKDTKPVYQCVN